MNYAKKILFAFAFLIICFKAKSFYSNIQVSKKYFLVTDNLLSESHAKTIYEFINENLTEQRPKEFTQKLQEKFPIIKSVVIRRTNPNFLVVQIKVHEPCCQINDDKVFSNNGKVFNKDCYFDSLINGLEAIKVENNGNENCQLYEQFPNFVSKVEPLLEDFYITWSNKNKIILTNKKEPNFIVLIKHDKIPDQKIIKYCENLYQELVQSKNNPTSLKLRRPGKSIVFDLRFSEQIILSD